MDAQYCYIDLLNVLHDFYFENMKTLKPIYEEKMVFESHKEYKKMMSIFLLFYLKVIKLVSISFIRQP